MVGTSEKTPEQIEALVKAGENTRFGAENGNKTAGELGRSPGSMRKNIRYFLRHPLTKGVDGKFFYEMPAKPTAAQILAAQEIEAAANRTDSEHMRRVEFITEQVDGKLAQVNVNTDLEKFNDMTEEELREYNRQLEERIAAAANQAGEDGTHRATAGHDTGGDGLREGAHRASAGEGQGTNEGATVPGSQ